VTLDGDTVNQWILAMEVDKKPVEQVASEWIAANKDTVEGVWRFPLANDSLGVVEKYYDLTANYYGAKVNGITFALDGDMFIATTPTAGSVLVVHPDRSAEKYYPGLLAEENVFITYNNDRHLFLSRTGPAADGSDKKVVRVNTQKQGAPYYGRP